ncbi:MAG: hypothetical protein Aureis2KO_25910 [Aureisphaera sp.]
MDHVRTLKQLVEKRNVSLVGAWAWKEKEKSPNSRIMGKIDVVHKQLCLCKKYQQVQSIY